MSGCYARGSDKQKIAEAFAVHDPVLADFGPSWNVAPQIFQPVIRLGFHGKNYGGRFEGLGIPPHSSKSLMPPVSEFTKFVGSMCARKMLNAYRLGQRLGVDPAELLKMINGKKAPTPKVVQGLAKALDVDECYLEKLAEQMREA
jgi:Helix-turn-helix